jgi:DNA-binding transcriptional regulator YhcF (GntR family)
VRRGESLTDRLRNHIVGEMHIGHVQGGDRLPTYREIAREWEVDHRSVAAAYRVLENEGLVEIRERRGVFLREQERIGGEMPTETAAWVADEVLNKPYIIVRMHPAAAAAVERHLREHDLKVVCLDPRFAERVQIFAENQLDRGIRVILADDAEAIARIDPSEPVLVSRAVAARLKRDFNFVVNPRTPAFDPSSARELARVLIRLNLEALEAKRKNRGA